MTHKLSVLAATVAVAGATTLAAMPAQAGGVSWGVSIGVPGFSVFAGQPAFGWAARPVVRSFAPVFVPAPALAPPVFVAPRVVYRPVARPWVRPVPVFRPRPVIVSRGW